MPLKANDKNGNLTFIDEAIEGQIYYCQVCNQPMIQRHCTVKVDHFAHYSPHGRTDIVPCCDHWGYDKTKWHFDWQKKFPRDCIERVLESHGKKHIADVLVSDYVVEFQHSPISLEEFNERNEFYDSLGYKVIWVFDLIEERESGRFAENRREWYYKWANAKKLFKEMDFDKIKATIYFQLFDIENREDGVLERVKEIHDRARLVKTDSKNCFSVFEFIDLVNENSNLLFEKPKPPEAPNSIEDCKTIVELWKESYSAMIVKNTFTSKIIIVFGQDGYLARDNQSDRILCKYMRKNPLNGHLDKVGDFYNVFDEDKKIWKLVEAYKDKNYENRLLQRQKRQEAFEKRREIERQQEEEKRIEIERIKSAEQDDCHTIEELVYDNRLYFIYVDNVFTNKRYYLKFKNGFHAFDIYEVDQTNIAKISGPYNEDMRSLYGFRIWKRHYL